MAPPCGWERSGSTLRGREPASTVVTTGQCTAQNPQYPVTVRLVSALIALVKVRAAGRRGAGAPPAEALLHVIDRVVSIPAPGSLLFRSSVSRSRPGLRSDPTARAWCRRVAVG